MGLNETVGRRIALERHRLGLSQGELGRRMAPPMSHAAVSEMEHGITRIDLDRLVDVARALGISVKPLLGWSDDYCPCCGRVLGGDAPPQEHPEHKLAEGAGDA